VILLPLLMLVVVIGTFPFTYYYTPGDTSAAGRWQYNEMTLVSGINMNASLDVCNRLFYVPFLQLRIDRCALPVLVLHSARSSCMYCATN